MIDEQMKGIRAINFGGVLKAIKKKYADIDKAELDAEDLKFWLEVQELIAQYFKQRKGYSVIDSRKL